MATGETERRRAAGEVTFADLMHCGGGRAVRPWTDAEHYAEHTRVAADPSEPLSILGTCHCVHCEQHRATELRRDAATLRRRGGPVGLATAAELERRAAEYEQAGAR